jgi:protein-tyrosine phosphatase
MLDDISQILMIDESFNFLNGVDGNVLIHCQAGRSRSAAILIAYIMYKDNMSYEESYNIVKKYHSIVELNSGFVKQLNNFIPLQI